MNRVTAASLVLAGCGLFAACGGQTVTPAPEGSFVDVPGGTPSGQAVPAEVSRFAAGMGDAVNWFAENPDASLQEFSAGFTPLWLDAALSGVTLTRRPVTEFGEVIVAPDAENLPGVGFFVEMQFDGQPYCAADSRVLYVPDVTEDQYLASLDTYVEYIAVQGQCEDKIAAALAMVDVP